MKIEINITKGPTSGPTTFEINMSKKQYSQPKLYIPKKNGKPTVQPGNYWYVWFLWRNPESGNLDIKFKYKKGINRQKTVKERKAVGLALVKAYETALDRGWNPITKTAAREKSTRKKATTLEKALKYAFEIKKGTKKDSTLHGYEFHLNRFLEWAKNNGYLGMDIYQFSIDNFYEFMDYIRFEYTNEITGEGISGSSVNNHKRSLSSLFTTLKNERMIPFNFIKDIPTVDSDPVNNKAFTIEELMRIKAEMQKEDPYLIPFFSFILYPVLRPMEICRLKVSDINTQNWMLNVETKTDKDSTRRIIRKLQPTIENMNLDKYPGKYNLFTPKNEPAAWDVALKSKVDHFGLRFRKIKNNLGFGREYGLYSGRHTAIMNLYNSYVDKGMGEMEILLKLMPITQHRSLAGIKNYLRQHKQSIPPDHSDLYTFDF